MDTELVYFDREYGVTGWRIDNEPKLTWEISDDGYVSRHYQSKVLSTNLKIILSKRIKLFPEQYRYLRY